MPQPPRSIAALLMGGETSVQAVGLGMNESDVSHQLCGLRQMHLVRVRKSGRSSTHLMTITWRAYSPSGSTTFNTDK